MKGNVNYKHVSVTNPTSGPAPSQSSGCPTAAKESLPLNARPQLIHNGAGDSFWFRGVDGRPDLSELASRLLGNPSSVSVHNVCVEKFVGSELAQNLIKNGLFLNGADAILFPMHEGCHENAAFLAGDSRVELWTGLAMARSNGCWHSHSWVVRRKDRRLIETTAVIQALYFGVRAKATRDQKGNRRLLDTPGIRALLSGQYSKPH